MRIKRPAEGARMFSVSAATFWRYSKAPDFPVAFRLGPNAIGYDEDELVAWLEKRRIVRVEGATAVAEASR